MKRSTIVPGLAAAAAAVALTACGPVEVMIVVELGEGEGAQQLNAVPVEVLPFDRDMVFDSLANAAPRPEPEVPPDLLAMQEQIAEARNDWRNAETQWAVLRDTLQKLETALEGLNVRERRYQELFLQWEGLEPDYRAAERAMTNRFEEFTALQDAAIGRMDSINFVLDDWAQEAFAEVDLVFAARTDASGLELAADTTEESGEARLSLAPGDYWVHARYELPTEELYWNVPITVVRGEPLTVRLTRENAESRPIF